MSRELTSAGTAGPLPADVRAAGADAQRTYRAAQGFERMLVAELTKALAAPVTEDGGEGSAAASTYRGMLPGTLADAVTGAGGLGLARQLYGAMRSER